MLIVCLFIIRYHLLSEENPSKIKLFPWLKIMAFCDTERFYILLCRGEAEDANPPLCAFAPLQ
jgi:hypothetical protein